MAELTQGTELWYNHPTDGVVKVGCVTAINGITASRDQIETTCLNSTARTYEPGMLNPGAATFTINFDPGDTSHTTLHALYQAGTKVDWALGWSDGTLAPTLDVSDDFVLTDERSWLLFNAYVSELPFDFALNAVVTSNVTLQLSDFPQLFAKSLTA
jgi:hypothetical protein